MDPRPRHTVIDVFSTYKVQNIPRQGLVKSCDLEMSLVLPSRGDSFHCSFSSDEVRTRVFCEIPSKFFAYFQLIVGTLTHIRHHSTVLCFWSQNLDRARISLCIAVGNIKRLDRALTSRLVSNVSWTWILEQGSLNLQTCHSIYFGVPFNLVASFIIYLRFPMMAPWGLNKTSGPCWRLKPNRSAPCRCSLKRWMRTTWVGWLVHWFHWLAAVKFG